MMILSDLRMPQLFKYIKPVRMAEGYTTGHGVQIIDIKLSNSDDIGEQIPASPEIITGGAPKR